MRNSLLVLLLIVTNLVTAQIKIGDNPQALDANSLLELESSSKALVISRVSEAEMLAIIPLQGALVYNIDASCIFYYDGTSWNNLCRGSSTGSIAWGDITGNVTNQADLVAELQNYVDKTTVQDNIAGEKTFTEKFTVNTGDTSAQIAEFLGRVKGENGTAPEDFVTLAQLDASGGGTWGSITGLLTDQTDLATEFNNYVNLTTTQSIAGEKTLTEKFTVNTGTLTDQAAEFLGRVKGENGTAAEDFVTLAQLDASGGGGTWGSITGLLTDQTDLADEFAKYVDLTTDQSIAGEKTLTEKLTVNTGDITAQSAEFLGRVKGEDGVDDEDFVTVAQLNAIASGGHTGIEGSIFFAGTDTQPTDDNNNLFWNATNKQLRIGAFTDLMNSNTDDLTTLNIQGSISKPVDQATTLTEAHHTIQISWTTTVTLPDPTTCFGRIYIIKVAPTTLEPNPLVSIWNNYLGFNKGYRDSMSETTLEFPLGVTQIQSFGSEWEQIN